MAMIKILRFRPANGNVHTEWIELAQKSVKDSTELNQFRDYLKKYYKVDNIDFQTQQLGT